MYTWASLVKKANFITVYQDAILPSNAQQDLVNAEARPSQEDQGVQAHLPLLSRNNDILITIPALLGRTVDPTTGVDNITDKVPVRSVGR